ncbi:hypothetical protein RLV_6316 [Rhizobium leguminosarum bv. viciae]|nr:hypothetical protein RLV_6316 [Rhizobium leguminosarum bv. viciae]
MGRDLERFSFQGSAEPLQPFVFTQFPAKPLRALPGKTASRFAWENRFALCLELL